MPTRLQSPRWLLLAAMLVALSACEAEPEEQAPELSEPELRERIYDLGEQFAAIYERDGDLQPLRERVRRLWAEHPDAPELGRLLAQMYMVDPELGEQAYRQFEKVIELEPDDAELRLLAAALAMEQGEEERAGEHYRHAVELKPEEGRPRLHLAQWHLRRGELDEAERIAREALSLDASLHTAYVALADIHAERADYTEALRSMEQAIERIPRDRQRDRQRWVTYVRKRAHFMRQADRPGEALSVLQELPAAEQVKDAIASEIAACWAELGQPEKAAEQYANVLYFDPSNDHAAASAAHWYLEAGYAREARRKLRTLRDINPRHPRRADLEQRLDELEEAEG